VFRQSPADCIPTLFSQSFPHNRQQLPDELLCLRRTNEAEIACLGSGEIRHHALLDGCALVMMRLSAAGRNTSVSDGVTPG
jgi:hypothetical protein